MSNYKDFKYVFTNIMSTAKTSMTGIIKSEGSRVMAKNNGASYVLQNVLITSGPATGLTVLATRTTITKDAKVKDIPALNVEVTLYHSVVPSTKVGEKNQHFFEISTGADTATNADLDAIFG
jgi:hypothetical protein